MQLQEGDSPFFEYAAGSLQLVGFTRVLDWRGSSDRLSYTDWLHGVCSTLDSRLSARYGAPIRIEITSPTDPTQPGAITLTIHHAPIPVPAPAKLPRARGQRGQRSSSSSTRSSPAQQLTRAISSVLSPQPDLIPA
jgi:hypothetical protein